MAVPFLSDVLGGTPETYQPAGHRRGTATSKSTTTGTTSGVSHDVLPVGSTSRGARARGVDAQGASAAGDAEPDAGVGGRRAPRRSGGAPDAGSSPLRRAAPRSRVADLGEWGAEDLGASRARSSSPTCGGARPGHRCD